MRFFVAFVLLFIPSVSFADDLCAIYSPSVDVVHQASDDVNLNSFDFTVPEKVVVPITKDFADDLGFDLEMLSQMGELTVFSNGLVVIGRQDITAQAQSYCAQLNQKDGQETEDVINSENSEEIEE